MSFRDKLNSKREEARAGLTALAASAAAEARRRDEFFAPVYSLCDDLNQSGVRFESGRVPRGSTLRSAAQRLGLGTQFQFAIDQRMTIVIRIATDDDNALLYDCQLQTLNRTMVGPQQGSERPLRTRNFEDVETWMADVVAQYEIPAGTERPARRPILTNDLDDDLDGDEPPAAEERPQRRRDTATGLSPADRTRVIDLNEE